MNKRPEGFSEDKPLRVGTARRLDHGVHREARVWIFLVLGVLTLVFSAALTGVYMNVRSLTSNVDDVEVMPSFVPAAACGMTGLFILFLFWRRYKVLVYGVLVLCTVTVVLCVITAVLTGTHIVQPLLSVSSCVFSPRARMCRCVTQYRRNGMDLVAVLEGDQAYLVLQGVSGCGDLQDLMPVMLFAMIAIYGILTIVCVTAGVISLLVYQTELRMRYLKNIEDDDICSAPPSPCSSGNYNEHHTMLPIHPASAHNATALINIYTNPDTILAEEENDDGNSDLTYGPVDVPMGYSEACNMRRCQSFSQPDKVLQEGSQDSSLSNQTVSLIGAERNTVRLQDHRKKGRRAVTLHGLDREQLLLILSLQMRYLQESDQSTNREVTSTNCNLVSNMTVSGPVSRFRCGTEGNTDGGPETRTVGGSERRIVGGPEGRTDGGPETRTVGGSERRIVGGPEGRTDGGQEGRADGGQEGRTDGGSERRIVGGPERRTDGGPEGRTDGGPETRTVGGSERRIVGGPERRTDGGQEGRTDGGPEGRTDGGPERRTVGGPERRTVGGPEGRTDGGPEGRTDGGPEGRTDGGPERRTDGGPEGRTDGGPEGRTDGGPERRTDGGQEGRTDGGPEGRTDGGPEGRTDGGPERRTVGGPERRTVGGPEGRTDGGPEGRTDGGPEGRTDGGPERRTVGGPEGRTDGGLSSELHSGCELEGGLNSRPSHCNSDLSWLHCHQRRAVTPTPWQERLSSNRTTDDDLDYRPAKLTRSHTPQPYHLKNPGQYRQNGTIPQNVQLYQPNAYQQHKQSQQQQSLAAYHDEEDDESPTLITYDLRNITKIGPIVYENVPLSGNCQSHPSNNAPLLQGSSSAKLFLPLHQTGCVQSSPAHQPDPASQILILGGNIHAAGKPWNQFNCQSSQASASSQVSVENSPSDTRKLVPAKENMAEPGQTKMKGKKRFKKNEKNFKKENETNETVSNQSCLSRTDSNGSKGGVVADRWQTLMVNGSEQVQTLWENVQRKVVSDPQTPDSTLALCEPPLSEVQCQTSAYSSSSFISPPLTPRHANFPAVTEHEQSMSLSQVVPNGILKNSQAITNYLPGTSVSTLNGISQGLPAPQNPNQIMQYPNLNHFPTHKLNDLYPNTFIPLATSSVGNYEDIDEVFPSGQQPSIVPSSTHYSPELHAVTVAQKQPMIHERQISKFGTAPSSIRQVSDSPGEKLRPTSYMSAVDRQVADRGSFITTDHNTLQPSNQVMDMECHMMTNLLIDDTVMDNIGCQATGRSINVSAHFVQENEHMHLQPQSNSSSEVIHGSSLHSLKHMTQNASHHLDEHKPSNNLQSHHLLRDDGLPAQWSAFQLSCSKQRHPLSAYEICDTDLDDLPRTLHPKQLPRGQMYSSPTHLASSVGYTLKSGTGVTPTRSQSNSSCETQNTSSTLSERSTSPSTYLQRRFPEHSGAHSQNQFRALHSTDRRFCVTQQSQQQQLKSHPL